MRPKTWQSALKINQFLKGFVELVFVTSVITFFMGLIMLTAWLILASAMLMCFATMAGANVQKNIERCEMELSYGNE